MFLNFLLIKTVPHCWIGHFQCYVNGISLVDSSCLFTLTIAPFTYTALHWMKMLTQQEIIIYYLWTSRNGTVSMKMAVITKWLMPYLCQSHWIYLKWLQMPENKSSRLYTNIDVFHRYILFLFRKKSNKNTKTNNELCLLNVACVNLCYAWTCSLFLWILKWMYPLTFQQVNNINTLVSCKWQMFCSLIMCVRRSGTVQSIGQLPFGGTDSHNPYRKEISHDGCLRNEHKLVHFRHQFPF